MTDGTKTLYHVSNTGKNYSATDVGRFRRYLPQILACLVRALVQANVGLSIQFPTIAIPALTDVVNDSTEVIHLSPSAASWFGSFGFMFETVGSLLAGVIREKLGYKYSLVVINIPACLAWILLYNAIESWQIFAGSALLGFTAGLMETPSANYVGETCEPAIRGILGAFLCLAFETGIFWIFLMASITAWRQVALLCLIFPITIIITTCIVPDAPIWLLSKNRTNDALMALQWLRGWVAPSAVQTEFEELQKYKDRSHACVECSKQDKSCSHSSSTFAGQFSSLFRRETLHPLLMVVFMFFIGQFTGLDAMRVYLVQIMVAYGVPFDPNWAITLTEVASISGIIILLCTVHNLGKRKVYLMSLALTAISCLTLSTYGYFNLPADWSSFEKHSSIETQIGTDNYFPFYVLVMFAFAANLGVIVIPWMLMCEVFPLKARGLASGIGGASNYIFSSISVKLYYNLESSLSMPGVPMLYATMGLLGFIVIYFILPETENRDLADIELYFTDNKRKITDRIIPRAAPKTLAIPRHVEDGVCLRTLNIRNDNLDLKNNGFVNKAFQTVQ